MASVGSRGAASLGNRYERRLGFGRQLEQECIGVLCFGVVQGIGQAGSMMELELHGLHLREPFAKKRSDIIAANEENLYAGHQVSEFHPVGLEEFQFNAPVRSRNTSKMHRLAGLPP
jgi:hypothetical protein